MKLHGVIFVLLSVIVGMALLARFLVLWKIPEASITSWYRNPAKNTEVGGAKRSAHLLGWGLDLVPVKPELEAKARNVFPFVLNEGDHIHVAWY